MKHVICERCNSPHPFPCPGPEELKKRAEEVQLGWDAKEEASRRVIQQPEHLEVMRPGESRTHRVMRKPLTAVSSS